MDAIHNSRSQDVSERTLKICYEFFHRMPFLETATRGVVRSSWQRKKGYLKSFWKETRNKIQKKGRLIAIINSWKAQRKRISNRLLSFVPSVRDADTSLRFVGPIWVLMLPAYFENIQNERFRVGAFEHGCFGGGHYFIFNSVRITCEQWNHVFLRNWVSNSSLIRIYFHAWAWNAKPWMVKTLRVLEKYKHPGSQFRFGFGTLVYNSIW